MAICRIVLKEQGEREMRDGQRERVGEIEREREIEIETEKIWQIVSIRRNMNFSANSHVLIWKIVSGHLGWRDLEDRLL